MIGTILVGICMIVLLMIVIPKLMNRKQPAAVLKEHVLLLGGKGSGKTRLLLQMARDESVESYQSSEMNVVEVKGEKVIDYPSNERMQQSLRKEMLVEKSKKIVFMIDSYDYFVQGNHKDVLQYLYDVFSYQGLHEHPPQQWVFLFTKMDLVSAAIDPSSFIPAITEALHTWIQTKEKHQLNDLSNQEQSTVQLGYEEEAFKLEDLPFPIETYYQDQHSVPSIF